MTILRLPVLPVAGLVFVIVTFTSLPALLVPSRAGLLVVYSDAVGVYDALAEHHEQHTWTSVDVVRVPASETLSHLAVTHGSSEFDVWLGGPAKVHAEAERLGLLRPVGDINASGLPKHYHSASWFGFYGGFSQST